MKRKVFFFVLGILMISIVAVAAHTDYLPKYLLSSFSVMDAAAEDNSMMLEDGITIKVMNEGEFVQSFSKNDLMTDTGYGWILLVNRMGSGRPTLVEMGNHENKYALFLSKDMQHEFRITEGDGFVEIAISQNHASGLTNYQTVKHDLMITKYEWSFNAARKDPTKPGEAIDVLGQIKNISGRNLEDLTAIVTFMDKDKRIIAEVEGKVSVETLRHAERAMFFASTEYNPEIVSAVVTFRNAGRVLTSFPVYTD